MSRCGSCGGLEEFTPLGPRYPSPGAPDPSALRPIISFSFCPRCCAVDSHTSARKSNLTGWHVSASGLLSDKLDFKVSIFAGLF